MSGSTRNWDHLSRIILSMGVSLAILGLMLKLTALEGDSAERATLAQVLSATSWKFVAVYVIFQLGQTIFRSERYRLLLAGSGEAMLPGRFHMFLVTAARNMFVDMLPARLGELSYIAMLNRGYRVSGQACVSSLSVAFLFDFVALMFIILGAIALPLLASDLRGIMLGTMIVLLILVLCAAFALFVGVRVFVHLLRMLPARWTEPTWIRKGIEFFDAMADALDNTRRAGIFWKTLGLSMGVRACKYSGLYLVFMAVAIPSFEALARAPVSSVLIALFSAEAGASLPVPTFMSFGTYEFGGLMALKALGFSAAASAVTMLAMHIVTQFLDYTLGGIALVLFVLSGARRRPQQAPEAMRPRYGLAATAIAVAFIGSTFLFMQYRAAKKKGRGPPEGHGAAVAVGKQEGAAIARELRDLDGFMVWSSNRYGNHDILLRSLPDRTTRQLTTHEHTETFPRISPDGRQVVFCRSQIPWVSQRDPLPWDVYVVDIEGGQERLVARNGNTPTWSEDGTKIYFQRDGGALVEHVVASGTETTLFTEGRDPIPAGVQLQTPDMDQKSGRLAVTFRGKRTKRMTALCTVDGDLVRVGGGSQCQLAWFPDGRQLYLVGHGGKQKNQVYRYEPDTGATTPWLDLAGDYSHEYFPQLSKDARYLVLGASTGERGQHEHDTSDYEIFLWPVGAGG